MRSIAIAVAITLAAAPARADIAAAARAFSDGQAAQLEGNYERAAQSFELAFNIAPTREALRSAVRARLQNNQLPRAATLAELLLALYADDAISVKLANEVLADARPRLARITVACTPQCTLALGGRATSLNAATGHVVFATPGRAVLEIAFDGNRSMTREFTLRAGEEVTVAIEPPAARPVAVARPAVRGRDDGGLPRSVAIGGVLATATLTALTIWSGRDTLAAHDAYVAQPTHERWTDGESKQLRTNVLLGATVATGVTTVLIAAFWTRWRDPHPADLAIAPTAGGATLSFGGSF